MIPFADESLAARVGGFRSAPGRRLQEHRMFTVVINWSFPECNVGRLSSIC